MTITDSEDLAIRTAAPRVTAGRKWNPIESNYTVYDAKSALHFRVVVGQVQHGRAGIGLIPKANQWDKATSRQKRQLVVEEMRWQSNMLRPFQWVNLEKRKLS